MHNIEKTRKKMSIIIKMKGAFMDKIDYKGLAAKLFCWGIFALIGIIFFKYFFSYTIPFLLAWGIAYAVYPLAQKINSKTKISRKVCSFVLVLFILVILLSLLFLIGNRILFEIQNLVTYLTDNSDKIAGYFENAFKFLNSLGERLPILNKLQNTEFSQNISDNINTLINNAWQSILERLGSAIPDVARGIVVALPNILLVSLITVIACFYFAIDVDAVNEKVIKILPNKIAQYLSKLKHRVIVGFKKYLKAYCILFIITFAELLVGFWILDVDYAFVLAILIALIDFLPVFGTGAVLVPWGIILLLMKNYFLGIGIIVLFVLMTIIRQIIEPKIVGKSLGVHPILTLITIYLGFKLFGLFGMIFLPIATLILFSKDEEEDKSKK